MVFLLLLKMSVVVLLLVCYQVSAHDFFYSELESLGGSCYPRDSCAALRTPDEDHLWGNRTCECGTHCTQYATCCIDSTHSGKSLNSQSRGEMCQRVPGFGDSFVLVSRCSDNMQYGYQISEKCERTAFHAEDPVTMAPVTSLMTHVTYKNYFCALCNYDVQNIFIWSIKLQFSSKDFVSDLSDAAADDILENLVYDKERNSWGIRKDDYFHKLQVKFALPTPLQKIVKKCKPYMVNQCDPATVFYHELQHKCSSYYAPIKVQDVSGHTRTYRNIHCVICSNVNVSKTDGITCIKLTKGKKESKPSFSFALLLDINRSDGDLVGRKQLCKDNEKWDPFFKKCRSLSCGLPGYVLRDGKCVQS